MTIPVNGSFTIKSEEAYFISDIKAKIYELARAEFLGKHTNGRVIFEEDLDKLSNKESNEFYECYHVIIGNSDDELNVNTSEHYRLSDFIYTLIDEINRLIEDDSYPYRNELIKSEIDAYTGCGDYNLSMSYTKNRGNKFFEYDDFVMQDMPLCDALKACGAFELNVGERWVGMEENFFVIMEKIAEEYKNDRTDMLFVMDNSHDEMNACYEPVLVKVRINKNNGDYHLIGYLNQYVKYTEKGESLDLESYPLERIMSNFFEDQDIATIDDIYSVSAVDKVSMMSSVGNIFSTYGLTVHIVLGCELKQKMLVKKYW